MATTCHLLDGLTGSANRSDDEQPNAQQAENARSQPDRLLTRQGGDRAEGDRYLQQRDTIRKSVVTPEKPIGFLRLFVALMLFSRAAFSMSFCSAAYRWIA